MLKALGTVTNYLLDCICGITQATLRLVVFVNLIWQYWILADDRKNCKALTSYKAKLEEFHLENI